MPRTVASSRLVSTALVAAIAFAGTLAIVASPASATPLPGDQPTPTCNTTGCEVNYSLTFGLEGFTVPAGVSSVDLEVIAAAGGYEGASSGGHRGGAGGIARGTLAVTPGDTFRILVGQMGGAGYGLVTGGGGPSSGSSGASGGGGSFIFDATGAPVLVAGGGGGAGDSATGGSGGGPNVNASNGQYCPTCGLGSARVATGASPSAAGSGGLADGTTGGDGAGPAAGFAPGNGGAAMSMLSLGSGGGGGGYYGGGGGADYESGGGGSGYAAPAVTGVESISGASAANGWVKISWTVSKAVTTTSLVTDPVSPAHAGTSVDLKALVAGGTGTPTGTVRFTAGGQTITDCGAVALDAVGTATCTTTLPASSTHTIQAEYSGDATRAVSTSAVQDFSVLAPLQVTTTSLPNATVGEPYSAVLEATGGSAPYVWTANALPPGLRLAEDGTISGVPTSGPGLAFEVTVRDSLSPYESASAPGVIVVAKGKQTITFAPLTGPVGVGDTQQLSAAGGDSGEPVTFRVGADTTENACSITGSTVSFDHAGTCVVVAEQAGSGDYAAAPAVQQSVDVSKVATSVTLAVTPDTTVFGQQPLIRSTVAGGVAGTVQFRIDGTLFGQPLDVVDGVVARDLPRDLAAGSHRITAEFTPTDGNRYAESAATPQTLVVNQAATNTRLEVGADSLKATVSAVSPGFGTPGGTVTFSVAGRAVGTAVLADGVGTLKYAVAAGQATTVSVTYSGEEHTFLASSASLTRRDPSITATITSTVAKSRSGWYRAPVKVTFRCAADGAALVGGCPAPVQLTRNGAAQSVSRTINAVDGGAATVSVTGINIDRARPAVRISGLNGAKPYFATAPRGRCVAGDRLSGVERCTLTRKRHGRVIAYVATAMDKAGNVTRVRRTVRVNDFVLTGARYRHGAYVVRAGRTYTMLAAGKTRPRYVDAMPYPKRPRGLDHAFYRTGPRRWALGVTFSTGMLRQRHWNIGLQVGHRMRVLKVRVVR